MFLHAVRFAVIRVARFLALQSPLSADKVWQAEGVLGYVGLHVVAAETAKLESILAEIFSKECTCIVAECKGREGKEGQEEEEDRIRDHMC